MTLDSITQKLRDAGIESAFYEALLLCEHFTGIPHSKLVIMRKENFDDNEKLCEAVEKRARRYPLQYILGEWYFMDEVYEVTPDVLVPRDDTEVLVVCGIERIEKNGRFADLCTGSGCVAISLLAKRPDLRCVAVEKYPEALDVAKRNSVKNGVSQRIEFICADVTEDVFEAGEMFDCILTNPPYISLGDYGNLGQEEKAEPRHALTDESDGLSIIRKIIEIYPSHIKNGGFLAIEIGYDQENLILSEARRFGLSGEILRDIEGRCRVAVLKK